MASVLDGSVMLARLDFEFDLKRYNRFGDKPIVPAPAKVSGPGVFEDIFQYMDKVMEAMTAECATTKSAKCDEMLKGLARSASKFADTPAQDNKPKEVFPSPMRKGSI